MLQTTLLHWRTLPLYIVVCRSLAKGTNEGYRLVQSVLMSDVKEFETYCSPDLRQCRKGVDNRKRHGLFLFSLSTSRCHPAKDDAVAGIDSDREQAHGEISSPGVESRTGGDESNDCHALCNCNVPGSFIHASFLRVNMSTVEGRIVHCLPEFNAHKIDVNPATK